MKLLISACLMGIRCRYDGKSCPLSCLEQLNKRFVLVPVCPEVLGGLEVPRPPAEIVEARVQTQAGGDVTAAYHKGSELALQIALQSGSKLALLKERSPACGSGMIHDGCFGGGLTAGYGTCAALLREHGISLWGESQVQALLEKMDAELLSKTEEYIQK